MMKIKTILGLVVISGVIGACSPKQPEQQPANLPEKKSQGVLTDAQQQTLDKAKKTEAVLDKATKDRMKEADDTSGEK